VHKEKQSKLDNKDFKCIFISYGVDVKGYKIWDHMARKLLYRKNVIFNEVKSSPIVLQLEEHEKNLVVHLPPKTKKDEQKNEQGFHNGPHEKEGSESLEEEEDTPPQTLRWST
jgi:hypothetical protein